MVLQFISRKVFLDYLGTEVLGLNTTAANLLQFLNLAELGVGTAVGFSLYKPLYEKETQTINEIVSLQGKLYRRIAYVVIGSSVVLMCFFPWIFSKMTLPLWYAYASFGVLLFSALLGYFINYKQTLLSADQKEYKIQYTYKASNLAKLIVQIFAVSYFSNGYVWWLALEIVFAIIASYTLSQTVKHTYPFLVPSNLSLKALNQKHPMIQTKIYQSFFHKFGGFVLSQISPLIIYGFASMTVVALYGNYMMIVLGIVSLVNALSNGLTAGIGNLVAEGDQKKIMPIFEELFSIRFLVASVMCFGMYTLAQPFITHWVGKEYLLPNSTLVLITGILFIYVSRVSIDSFIWANGFYSDIYAPLIEAALNVCCSIVLGFFFGLNGILMGVLISLIIVVLGWKPVFLFNINLKYGLKQYLKSYLLHFVLASIAAIIFYRLLHLLPIDPSKNIVGFIFYCVIDIVGFSALLAIALWSANCGIRSFGKRLQLMWNRRF